VIAGAGAIRRTVLYGFLGAAGLALYLWPALEAPVVLTSDSRIDLAWAREGAGILSPVTAPRHWSKPAYLLFLRASILAGPEASLPRRIVVVQSVLVWLSIAASALLVARAAGAGPGLVVYVVLLLFLRLRDVCSTVMPEALAAALALPICALLLRPPRGRAGTALLGAAVALLALVRPNVGGVVFVLLIVSCVGTRRFRDVLPPALAFVAIVVPVWAATRSGDPLQDLRAPLDAGSRPYFWYVDASASSDPREQTRTTLRNWRQFFREPGADRRRELVWRAGHGLLGTEFYDARWDRSYEGLSRFSRRLTPFLMLFAVAILIVRPGLGLWIVGLLTLQSVVLGGLSRYALPLLPLVLLFACAKLAPSWNLARSLAAGGVFLVLLLLARAHPYVLDEEWGLLERAGLSIEQPIPRGGLPSTTPATLHLRVGRPVLPSRADLEVLGPGGQRLYASEESPAGDSAFLTVPLPAWLLEENLRGAVVLTVASSGEYNAHHYWLFPVIPPLWAPTARRDGSPELSPATGIASGSLDWWAHPGEPGACEEAP
jgi:hypothetical protein